MRLLDCNVRTGRRFVLFGESLVELLVKFSSRIVGDVQKFDAFRQSAIRQASDACEQEKPAPEGSNHTKSVGLQNHSDLVE